MAGLSATFFKGFRRRAVLDRSRVQRQSGERTLQGPAGPKAVSFSSKSIEKLPDVALPLHRRSKASNRLASRCEEPRGLAGQQGKHRRPLMTRLVFAGKVDLAAALISTPTAEIVTRATRSRPPISVLEIADLRRLRRCAELRPATHPGRWDTGRDAAAQIVASAARKPQSASRTTGLLMTWPTRAIISQPRA